MPAVKEIAPCYLCTEAEAVHAGRCNPCNALQGRARTAGKQMGSWEDFMKSSKERRTHFFQHGHDAMGKELKALIEETISESMIDTEMEAWIKDGKYLDLQDITKKYEGKPDQLESILVRTRTYFCNIRNTKLYEDPEYASKKSSSLEARKEAKRMLSVDRTRKAGKVAKVADDNAVQEDLGPGQVNMLTKEVAALNLPEKNLADLLSQAQEEGVANLIPAPVLQKLNLSIASLASQRTLIDLTVENKKGDVQDILKDIKAAKTEATQTAKIIKAQLVVAKSFVVPAAAAPLAADNATGNG
jgi:hypothetical protein